MSEAERPARPVVTETRTQLAYERTRVASERTLMAWTRTAVSLVGFGFSIPKIFEYLEQTKQIERPRTDEPAEVGTMLIALGMGSLIAGMLQHVMLMRRIALPGVPRHHVFSAAMGTAGCMLILGVYALAKILLRR